MLYADSVNFPGKIYPKPHDPPPHFLQILHPPETTPAARCFNAANKTSINIYCFRLLFKGHRVAAATFIAGIVFTDNIIQFIFLTKTVVLCFIM